MYSESLLESLIQKIYEAAVGAVGWTPFLAYLGAAVDGIYPALFLTDPSNLDGSIAVAIDFGDREQREYESYYARRNVWIQSARASGLLEPGVVRASQMLCSRQEFLRSEYYAGFCRPLGMTRSLGMTILREGRVTANIGVFRDEHQASFGQDEFALMRALFPHLQRGLKMYERLSVSEARGRALEAVLHALPTPVLLVSRDGRVTFVNAAADQLIRASDGLVVEHGILRALLPDDTRLLRSLIADAAQLSAGPGPGPGAGRLVVARKDSQSGGTLRVSRAHGREPLEILVSPLPTSRDQWLLQQPPVAAVFVADPSRSVITEVGVLVKLYGLTATEAKVAAAVARGLSGKEISQELEIRYNTLKTHLKHTYAKTGTKHRSDLVRLLARTLHFARAGEGEKT